MGEKISFSLCLCLFDGLFVLKRIYPTATAFTRWQGDCGKVDVTKL